MRVLFGTTTVTTAGTRAQLSNTADRVKNIQIQPRVGNTGRMFVGLSNVSATVAGWELSPSGGNQNMPPLKLDFGNGSVLFSVFYVDSTVNAEIIDWVAILE